MNHLQDVLITVISSVITVSVTAAVWITLAAGLYQLVRDNVSLFHAASRDLHELVQNRRVS